METHIEPMAIAPGFGRRLREERTRLGLTQEQLAQLAGIQRLAQGQYETEKSPPNVRYLASIGGAGVNLYYLIFGKPNGAGSLPPTKRREIEQRVFELIEDYVSVQCAGRLSAEGRYVLFETWRAHLFRVAERGADDDLRSVDLLPNIGGGRG
jgi:transcriptional regulator with XRE-family HTH domain